MTPQLLRAITEEEQGICFAIRKIVFMERQGISEEDEFEGLDHECEHYLLKSASTPLGTARIRYIDDRARIERVAILPEFQKQGYGTQLMNTLLQEIAKKEDIKTVELGAQKQAIQFYERLGFKSFGDEYLNAGIPHIEMLRSNI